MENLLLAVLTVAANALVTWGVISTKLDWLRRDVDRHESQLQNLIQKGACK